MSVVANLHRFCSLKFSLEVNYRILDPAWLQKNKHAPQGHANPRLQLSNCHLGELYSAMVRLSAARSGVPGYAGVLCFVVREQCWHAEGVSGVAHIHRNTGPAN